MRKTLIVMTAASALALGFSTSAFAAGCGVGCFNGNHSGNGNNSHNTAIIGSSLINLGGQNNGNHSVSGVLNEQNLTGNGSIQNNNAPGLVVVF
jgi:hypothetical protein